MRSVESVDGLLLGEWKLERVIVVFVAEAGDVVE